MILAGGWQTASIILLVGGMLIPATIVADDPVATGDGTPPGFAAALDRVPTLAPKSMPTAYRLDWQKRLLTFQRKFESATECCRATD